MSETRPAILAICGSERAGGNTDRVLDHIGHLVTGAGANYRVIHLREAAIRSGCGPCGDCNVRPVPCAEADDVAAVVDAMCQADAIVYAAPVHAFGMAALMQQFLERAGVGHLRFARPLRNKVALPVVTGRRYHHEFVYNQLLNNILLNRMIPAVAGFPSVVHGGAPGSWAEDDEGRRTVEAGVERMLELVDFLARATRAGQVLDGHSAHVSNERIFLHQGVPS